MAFRFVHDGITARVQVNALLPKLVGRDGITILRTIYLAGGQGSISGYILGHEWRHVKQWRDLGAPRFSWRWVSDTIRIGWKAHPPRFSWRWIRDVLNTGYRKNPLEIEAHLFGLANVAVFERWAKRIRGGA